MQRGHFDLKRAREGRLGGMFWSMYVYRHSKLTTDVSSGLSGSICSEEQELIDSFTECTTEIEGPDFLNATDGVRGQSPLIPAIHRQES